jgi:hypothetical protein
VSHRSTVVARAITKNFLDGRPLIRRQVRPARDITSQPMVVGLRTEKADEVFGGIFGNAEVRQGQGRDRLAVALFRRDSFE